MGTVLKRKPEMTEEEWRAQLEAHRAKPHVVPDNKISLAEKVTRMKLVSTDALTTAAEAAEKMGPEDFNKAFTVKTAAPQEPEPELEEEGFQVINGKGAVLKRIRWCWPGRLAFGKLNLFCGNPDHGKSLASLDVVAKVTTGSDWYDCKNTMEPIEVLIVAAEDGWEDTIAPRLVSANADLSKIHYLKSVVATLKDKRQIKRTLQLDSDVKFLEKFLNEHPKVRLLVIDPVSSYLGRAKMGDEQAVRDVLNPLAALAEETGICVLVIMHLNKKVDLDAVNRVGGAMAFVGVPRLAWIFAKKSEDESDDDDEDPDREPVEQANTIFMMKLKGNIVKAGNGGLTFLTEARELQIEEGKDWIPYVNWTGTTQKSLEELSAKKKSKRKGAASDKKTEIRLWLQDFLKGGAKPVTGQDGIHEHAKQVFGASDATVERVKLEMGLKAEPRIGENGKKRWYWSLPEADGQEAIGF
jgi:putative DNA primase/helicase